MAIKRAKSKAFVTSYFGGGLKANRKEMATSEVLKHAFNQARAVRIESMEEYGKKEDKESMDGTEAAH